MLTMPVQEFVEFVVIAWLVGWVSGIATHGLVTDLERWLRR